MLLKPLRLCPIPSNLLQSSSINLTQKLEDTKPTHQLRQTNKMLKALLKALLTQFQARKATNSSGFKIKAQAFALEAVQRVACSKGLIKELTYYNKQAQFKETQKNFKILEGMLGFGQDNEIELFIADNKVQDSIIKV